MNYIINTLDFDRLPTMTRPERNDWIVSIRLFNSYYVFSDGSRIENDTCTGVYIPKKKISLSYRLPENQFQAELMAILKAVSIIGWNITV